MQRRDFLNRSLVGVTSLLSAGLTASPHQVSADESPRPTPLQDRLCLFTDHLDDFGYTYAELASMLEPLKIAGPDLTVRSGGVVLPDRAIDELPKAAAAFRDKGMTIPMLSTQLTSAENPAARPILSTMGQLGIRYFKLGYYHYHDIAHWEQELEARRKDLAGLLDLCGQHSVHAGYHNHAGAGIGGALWDAWELLRPLDRARVGFYFDPSHASIEGAKHTWKLNLQRISPRLSMVALKDYVWEKTSKGWQTRWCPLGEGMVNWKEFFQTLIRLPFPGPVSLHIEYNPGGSTRPERIDNSLAAAQRDLAFVRQHLSDASK